MDLKDLTYKIRGAIFTVHNELGPGLLESVYEAALLYELKLIGLSANSQVGLPVHYKKVQLELGFRVDLIVENAVIVEIKSIETLAAVHHKQLLTYLKLTSLKVGLLINFNELLLKNGLKRIVNNF